MKKNFFPTYAVLEKSEYHLIVAISVELPVLSIRGNSLLLFENFTYNLEHQWNL